MCMVSLQLIKLPWSFQLLGYIMLSQNTLVILILIIDFNNFQRNSGQNTENDNIKTFMKNYLILIGQSQS